MGFLAPILGLLGGAAGSQPQSSTTTTDKNITGSSNTSQTQQLETLLNTLSQLYGQTTQQGVSTTTPNLSPGALDYINKLQGGYSKLMTTPLDLSGYSANQAQTINNNTKLQQQNAEQQLAARGLSTSPTASTTLAGIDANRVAQISQMQNTLPLLQNQIRQQNLSAAGGFASMLPSLYGGTTQQGMFGTTAQTQTGQQTGSQYGTSYGQTQSQQDEHTKEVKKVGGGLGGALGGVGSILGMLFGGK